jgi:DNA-binding response OmpR family regulator
MRILLLEDDEKAARRLSKRLHAAGFLVDVSASVKQADTMADAGEYAVIIADWVLSGITLRRRLRGRGVMTPILVLTARRALKDCLNELSVGADDYVTKPFAFAELLSRLHTLLGRAATRSPVALAVSDLCLDPRRHEVTRAGTLVNLTPKEFAILEMLMRRPGQVLTRTSLGKRLWHGNHDVANVVDVHMSHLRKKIDRVPLVPLIHTVWGRGYRLGPAGG